MIFAGAGNGVSRVGLLLLQPVKAAIKPTIVQTNANPTEPNDLPMHPPRPVVSRGELSVRFWKAPSVEARIFFSKLSRVRVSEPAAEIPEAKRRDLVFRFKFTAPRRRFHLPFQIHPADLISSTLLSGFFQNAAARARRARSVKTTPFHLMQPTTIDDVCSELLYL
jgi:hypothetical protein